MLRRSSARGFLILAVASAVLFVPLAAAANADRTTQTLTLLSLVLLCAAQGLMWLALGTRRVVRVWFYPLAAMAGGLCTVFWVGRYAASEQAASDIAYRVLVSVFVFTVGSWLFAWALRLAFPRRVRVLAGIATVLLLVGLVPGPWLLFQPSAAALRIVDVELQLHAGYLFWTVGAALLVAPFLALVTVPGDWFDRWWSAATQRVMSVPDRWFVIGISVVACLFALFFTLYSFDRRPTTADEVAQLWHARMLLTGRLAMPADPNPEFFAIDNIIDRPVGK